jgi:hypothetical protein
VTVILRAAVFKKISKKQKRKTFFLKHRNYVEKEHFKTNYGEIEIYTVNHYCSEKKAKEIFSKNFGGGFHTADEHPSNDYVIKLCAKRILYDLKTKKAETVYINCQADFKEIEAICRYAKQLYLNEELYSLFAQKLFENCGVLPRMVANSIFCDRVLDGKETPQVKLSEELLEVCPKEFTPTLFCSLLYTENGYFTG